VKLSPVVQELLALHEVFRRLGFLARDLYVEIYDNMVQFSLRIGSKEVEPAFVVDVSTDKTGLDTWAEAVEWWNRAANVGVDHDLTVAIYDSSWVVHHKVQLLMKLSEKGLITSPSAATEKV